MGVAPAKIMFCGHSFEVVLVNVITAIKQVNKKYKKIFVILQSIGIIVIKGRETIKGSLLHLEIF